MLTRKGWGKERIGGSEGKRSNFPMSAPDWQWCAVHELYVLSVLHSSDDRQVRYTRHTVLQAMLPLLTSRTPFNCFGGNCNSTWNEWVDWFLSISTCIETLQSKQTVRNLPYCLEFGSPHNIWQTLTKPLAASRPVLTTPLWLWSHSSHDSAWGQGSGPWTTASTSWVYTLFSAKCKLVD